LRRHPYGGGPAAEHNFTTGLLLHHCLTGNPDSRGAVISLAEWVIGMDDGRRNLLGVLDDSPTGRANCNARGRAPGRAAGNSMNALLDAWVLTRDARFLMYCETLIRRCIHPSDDIDVLRLLDVEKNWSYTVFLRALAKYLDLKAEANQIDSTYSYAQASLVAYATWMLAQERPYFDQVEKLEFPTEAWAAQEFRKANVLRLAARHVDEPLCAQLMSRGNELGERAWQDLIRFDSRASARALAITLIEGLLDCTLRSQVLGQAPRVAKQSHDFGQPTPFIPQWQRVLAGKSDLAAATRMIGRLMTPSRWARFLRRTVASANGKK
jgi:hypothetical protein